MRTIRLGRTQAEVPAVSLGTWGHGGPKTVGRYPVGWSGHDDRAATAALLLAYRRGLNHWDTADVYGDGQAEALIGALWDRVDRDKIFLASKVGWDPGSFEHYYHPEQIRRRLERSLRKLQTDYLDLYYLHHCDFGAEDQFLDDAIEQLRRFRSEGKIRFIGLSDWQPARIARFADRVDPDVVQPYRNVLDDDYARSGLKSWVDQHDAGVAFFSPLKHGLLLGRYESPVEFPAGDHRRRIAAFKDPAELARLRSCRERLEDRFGSHPHSVLHALVGALLTDSPTACVLVGLRTPAHVESASTVGQPLTPVDAAWVRRLFREPRSR